LPANIPACGRSAGVHDLPQHNPGGNMNKQLLIAALARVVAMPQRTTSTI
jgi:hypothetical protein